MFSLSFHRGDEKHAWMMHATPSRLSSASGAPPWKMLEAVMSYWGAGGLAGVLCGRGRSASRASCCCGLC